jgi:hypothetical protein
MNTLKHFLLIVSSSFFFISCQNKTKNLLVKKWDCVQVENLTLTDNNFTSKEDSAMAIKIETALKNLSWTFNKNNTYQCGMGNSITIQGTYEISADEKKLVCTPLTKNSVNTYTITALSEIELALNSMGTTVPLILHFRPN